MTQYEIQQEAIAILEGAIAWIKGESDRPATNNFDAVEMVVSALRRVGVQ